MIPSSIQRFKEYVATTVIATDQQGQLNGGLHELSTKKQVLKHQEDIMDSLGNLERKSMKQDKKIEQNEQNEKIQEAHQENEYEEKRICIESDDSNGFEIFE